MKAGNLKARILAPLAVTLVLLGSVSVFAVFWMQRNEVKSVLETDRASVQGYLRETMSREAGKMEAIARVLLQDDRLIEAFENRDREAVLARTRLLFHDLRSEHGITHLYFSDPERVNLVRVHRPEQHGDTIWRTTTMEASRTGRPAFGLELGHFRGLCTLRTVLPWKRDGRIIGYVELGKEVADILSQVHEVIGTDLWIAIHKEYLRRDYWEAGMRMFGRKPEWDRFSCCVLLGGTAPEVPPAVEELLSSNKNDAVYEHAAPVLEQEIDGRLYHGSSLPLLDVTGREIGHLVFLRDISSVVAHAVSTVGNVALITVVAGGALFGFFLVFVHRLERSLRETGLRLRLQNTALDSAANTVIVTDHEGRVLYANPAFTKTSGYEPEEILGNDTGMLEPLCGDDSCASGRWKELAGDTVWTGRVVGKNRESGSYVEDATVTPVSDSSGRAIHYVYVARNVTREADLEEQVRQTQKLDALGKLAGGVAHDFNNNLTVILGNAALLKDQLNGDTAQSGLLDRIERASRRATNLTRQLLGFARRGMQQETPVAVNDLLRDLSDMLTHTFQRRIVILHDLAAERDTVMGDPDQLHQVFMNLAINARDAMLGNEAGGEHRLVLRTESVRLAEAETAGPDALPAGDYLRVSVEDSGPGIDESVMGKIFDPFFTTKPRGKGTGMGLSTVYGIVKTHQGRVHAVNGTEGGAVFRILLPLCEEPSVSVAEDEESELQEGAGTILVVDDEEPARTTTSDMLEVLGYEVRTASGGTDAVRMYESAERPFDLVLTDLNMPGMDGLECFRRIRSIDPAARVVLMTGYNRDKSARDTLELGMTGFLAKPYTLQELGDAVAEALAGGDPAHPGP